MLQGLREAPRRGGRGIDLRAASQRHHDRGRSVRRDVRHAATRWRVQGRRGGLDVEILRRQQGPREDADSRAGVREPRRRRQPVFGGAETRPAFP